MGVAPVIMKFKIGIFHEINHASGGTSIYENPKIWPSPGSSNICTSNGDIGEITLRFGPETLGDSYHSHGDLIGFFIQTHWVYRIEIMVVWLKKIIFHWYTP